MNYIKNSERIVLIMSNKKMLSFIMSIAMVILIAIPAYSFTSVGLYSSEEAITDYVKALNNNDWTSLIDISPSADYEENVAFFSNQSNIDSNVGFHAIDTAALNTVTELDCNLLYEYTNADYYVNLYGNDLKLYLVGVELGVKKESQYFYNGLNFFLATLAQESGQWKVVLFSQAPASVIESNIRSRSSDVTRALEIIRARYEGLIMGSDGNVIETNIATPEQLLEEKGAYSQENTAISPRVVTNKTRPSTINVYRDSTQKIESIDYYDYCKNVLPNEWISSWNAESLKAGAQAVKFVAWYRVYNAKYPGKGYDVKDTTADQVYKPNTEVTNTTNAINAVSGVGLLNSSNELFYPAYAARYCDYFF